MPAKHAAKAWREALVERSVATIAKQLPEKDLGERDRGWRGTIVKAFLQNQARYRRPRGRNPGIKSRRLQNARTHNGRHPIRCILNEMLPCRLRRGVSVNRLDCARGDIRRSRISRCYVDRKGAYGKQHDCRKPVIAPMIVKTDERMHVQESLDESSCLYHIKLDRRNRQQETVVTLDRRSGKLGCLAVSRTLLVNED